MSNIKLRSLWFSIHKWIGITLAIIIIPLSLSGAALVWHDALDAAINPARYAVSGGGTLLAPSAYVSAALARLDPDKRVASLRFPDEGGPVIVSAAKVPMEGGGGGRHRGGGAGGGARGGPPARTNVYLNPADAAVLDVAQSNAGLVRMLHGFHGSLLVPGVGRQIVGWIGVAMLISSLTGIWLWWPVIGRWTRGFRWQKSRDLETNLHHQAGFWIAIPLAMLSLTGVWISFPAFFSAISGSGQQQGPGGPGGPGRGRFAPPLADTVQTPDRALQVAMVDGGKPVAINWPNDKDAPLWRISIAKPGGGTRDVSVDDRTGEAQAARGGQAQGGGGIARTMRQLHDGDDMGPVWQAIIFIGGIIPALLGVTGIIMWLRTRTWRAKAKAKRAAA